MKMWGCKLCYCYNIVWNYRLYKSISIFLVLLWTTPQEDVLWCVYLSVFLFACICNNSSMECFVCWLKEAVIKFCTRSGSYSKCEKILEFLEMPKAEVCGPGGFSGTNILILIVQIIKNKNLYAFTMCQSMTSTVSTYRSWHWPKREKWTRNCTQFPLDMFYPILLQAMTMLWIQMFSFTGVLSSAINVTHPFSIKRFSSFV